MTITLTHPTAHGLVQEAAATLAHRLMEEDGIGFHPPSVTASAQYNPKELSVDKTVPWLDATGGRAQGPSSVTLPALSVAVGADIFDWSNY